MNRLMNETMLVRLSLLQHNISHRTVVAGREGQRTVLSQRRALSSPSSNASSSSSSKSTSTSSTTVRKALKPPLEPPVVVGRTAWFQQRDKLATTTTTTTTGGQGRPWKPLLQAHEQKRQRVQEQQRKASEPPPPWPRSVIYTGYVLGLTLVPYIVIWIATSNRTLRKYFLAGEDIPMETTSNDNSKSWLATFYRAIRRHYGKEDYRMVSYVDLLHDGPDILYMDELPLRIRRQQAIIDQVLENEMIPVQITYPQNATFDAEISSTNVDSTTTTIQTTLSASIPARIDTIWTAALKSNNNNNNNSQASSAKTAATKQPSTLAISFPDPPTTADGMNNADSDNFVYSSNNDTGGTEVIAVVDDTNPATTTRTDPLLKTAFCYSPWYYHPVAPTAASDNAASSTVWSDDQMDQGRLQHEINALEEELHNQQGTRAIDDIMEEIKRKKSELSALKWRKWIPWSTQSR